MTLSGTQLALLSRLFEAGRASLDQPFDVTYTSSPSIIVKHPPQMQDSVLELDLLALESAQLLTFVGHDLEGRPTAFRLEARRAADLLKDTPEQERARLRRRLDWIARAAGMIAALIAAAVIAILALVADSLGVLELVAVLIGVTGLGAAIYVYRVAQAFSRAALERIFSRATAR